MVGSRIGTVSTIRAKPSMKQPPIRCSSTIRPMIIMGLMSRPPTQSESMKGIWVTAMNRPKTMARPG